MDDCPIPFESQALLADPPVPVVTNAFTYLSGPYQVVEVYFSESMDTSVVPSGPMDFTHHDGSGSVDVATFVWVDDVECQLTFGPPLGRTANTLLDYSSSGTRLLSAIGQPLADFSDLAVDS